MNKNPSFFSGDDRLPVENVSWFDAVDFCNARGAIEGLPPFYRIEDKLVDVPDWSSAGYRLPTEAEWEYACRAGTTTRFSCGDKQKLLKEYAWYRMNAKKTIHPVGELKPNAFGLHDMHGNVVEWCWDGFDSNYYSKSPINDPRGPERPASRMSRGGTVLHPGQFVRSAQRFFTSPDRLGTIYGFPCEFGCTLRPVSLTSRPTAMRFSRATGPLLLVPPPLDRLGIEARIMVVLFTHDLLFVRRSDLEKPAGCEWRIASFQPTIDDRGQVNGAVARVHATFHPAVKPGQAPRAISDFQSLQSETPARQTCRHRGLTAIQIATRDQAAFRRSGAWRTHHCLRSKCACCAVCRS